MREHLNNLLFNATSLRDDLIDLIKSLPVVANLLPPGKSPNDLSLTELVKICIAIDQLTSTTPQPPR